MIKVIENFLPESYNKDLSSIANDENFAWFWYPSTFSNVEHDITKITEEQTIQNGMVVDNKTVESQQFVHTFCHNGDVYSNYYDTFRGLTYFIEMNGIKVNNITRMKMNLITRDKSFPDDHYNVAHSDIPIMSDPKTSFTLLYYLDDSDGDTFFFENTLHDMKKDKELVIHKRISPRKNTAVLFNSNILHASSPPRTSLKRIALNIVFQGAQI
jgi:ectoine hydroxylase-related dioxygenase (phytanoyl-CoA dioxygenase family)